MKVVYVAGPYRANSEYGVMRNIQKAEDVAIQVWLAGAACICPHKNTAFFGGAADDSLWLDGDREILNRCDAIMCVPGWENSIGASSEIEMAKQKGMPVFETLDELRSWLGA